MATATDDPLAGLELTTKQRRFVLAYTGEARWNAAQAARLAGYAWPVKQGPQQLGKTSVRSAVERLTEAEHMGRAELLARFAAEGRVDASLLAECYRDDVVRDDDGAVLVVRRVIDWEKIRAYGLGPLIRKVTPTKYGDSIEFTDTQRAKEMIGKALQVFGSDTSITLNVDPSKLTNEELDSLIARLAGRKG